MPSTCANDRPKNVIAIADPRFSGGLLAAATPATTGVMTPPPRAAIAREMNKMSGVSANAEMTDESPINSSPPHRTDRRAQLPVAATIRGEPMA